jgi:hypothetical protein
MASFFMRTGQPAPYDALVLHSTRTADFDIGSVERVLGNAPRERRVEASYHVPVVCRMQAGLNPDGKLLAWSQRYLNAPGRREPFSIPYVIPHQSIRAAGSPVPIGQTRWSIVDRAQHAFCVESFMDEVAAAAHQDPLEFRRRLLPPRSRERRVLDAAASIAEWGTRLSPRRGRGISLTDSGESVTAEVVELSVDANGDPLIHRVVAVVDDGDGIGSESIWDASGPGQPGRPPSCAAVSNAIAAAIGRRIRTLPLAAHR